jgi:hypothetical protein
VLQAYRRRFNEEQFSAARYQELLARLDVRMRSHVDFRVCETPCFFSKELLDGLVETGRRLVHQLIDDPQYMRDSEVTIPAKWRVPEDGKRPSFVQVDLGLARNAAGALEPKLVELQAFPSLYGYQEILTEEYCRVYGLGDELRWRFGGMDSRAYWEVLRRTIVGDHAAENVVLTEVEPEQQKTRADFNVYEDRLGVRTVDIAKVRQEGKRLFYERDGRWVAIERIYNRAIVDEMERKGIVPGFDYREELEVEWAGQPNWYFRVSKFSLPYLHDSSVPKAVFLEDWLAGRRGGLPEDRERLLLKPLYSFAGKGIQFRPTDAELLAIPVEDRRLYLLQERVSFAPVIETPWGLTQAEIRVMYCWPEEAEEMIPMTSLVRLGRGLMMGVDHNRNQEWVGGSSALFPG